MREKFTLLVKKDFLLIELTFSISAFYWYALDRHLNDIAIWLDVEIPVIALETEK